MHSKCPSGNFCLKALEEIRHGLPNKRLSGTSFNFLIWKNESNQTHVSGQTLKAFTVWIVAMHIRLPSWVNRAISSTR